MLDAECWMERMDKAEDATWDPGVDDGAWLRKLVALADWTGLGWAARYQEGLVPTLYHQVLNP